jgi:hypothetical protein
MNVNELFNYYQKQVSEIPELRQLVVYKCEIAVDIIKFLMENNYFKSMDMRDLMHNCLQHLKGRVNPAMVKEIIKEWQETK